MGGGQTPGTPFSLTVRCLSIHADYGCRRSGACCTAGWRIPLDDALRRALEAADEHGGLQLCGGALETDPCQFFDPESHLCAIHHHKPSSCRHFPRVALIDARGVSLTLSHFCPTAASMLLRSDPPLAIVDGPPSFPPTEEYEGLDAREVMPPLLRPGMLWDLEGYTAWEEQAIALLGRAGLTPEAALDQLLTIAARVEEWTPGEHSLREHVRRAFDAQDEPARPRRQSSVWGEQGPVVNRYLAARLFASWVPYRADRLSALVIDLRHAHAVLKEEAARAELTEAIRATDWRIVHGS